MRISAGIPTIECKIFSIIPAWVVPAPKQSNPYTARNIIPDILQILIAEGVIFSRILRNITVSGRKIMVSMNDANMNNRGG